MKKAASGTKKVKGQLFVEGIRTTYQADGVTVKDQKIIIKHRRGVLFSQRFLVSTEILSVDEATKVMVDAEGYFPPDTELTLQEVKAVEGSRRTYEGKLSQIIRPLAAETLRKLVSSQTLSKKG